MECLSFPTKITCIRFTSESIHFQFYQFSMQNLHQHLHFFSISLPHFSFFCCFFLIAIFRSLIFVSVLPVGELFREIEKSWSCVYLIKHACIVTVRFKLHLRNYLNFWCSDVVKSVWFYCSKQKNNVDLYFLHSFRRIYMLHLDLFA